MCLDLTIDLSRPAEVRRFEVITGVLGRRRWTPDDRARIIAETLEPGAVVSQVARRYGLKPQQLFTWRREARQRTDEVNVPVFVPAMIAPEPEPEPAKPARKARASNRPKPRRTRSGGEAAIKMEAAGVTIWIDDGASPATIAAVISALKGVS